MRVKECLWALVPYAAVVMVECLDVGLATLSKAAMSRGMSHFAFVVYSNTLATLIIFPWSFFSNRTKRPPLTYSILCKFFLLALVGITVEQNCVFTGIGYSSPTLGSAMSNLIPVFTFILAFIFRVERMDLKSSSSQIKIIGSLVSIAGALIVTLYKGPSIGTRTIQPPRFPSVNLLPLSATAANWVLGGLFLAIACLCVSIWNTLQAAILKEYPAEITIISFYCLFGTIQCAVVSMIAERNPTAWALRPDLELISIVYSAVVGSIITPGVLTWCIHQKGPLFVAMFKPLGIAIAALMGIIFLGDTLHLGSVVGATIIVVGFYGVIWAQFKERKTEQVGAEGLKRSPERTPFLQTTGDV